jgi:hypothetical protein
MKVQGISPVPESPGQIGSKNKIRNNTILVFTSTTPFVGCGWIFIKVANGWAGNKNLSPHLSIVAATVAALAGLFILIFVCFYLGLLLIAFLDWLKTKF